MKAIIDTVKRSLRFGFILLCLWLLVGIPYVRYNAWRAAFKDAPAWQFFFFTGDFIQRR